MKRLFRYVLLIAVVLLTDSLAMAAAAETANFARLVDIGGGRKMFIKCSGKGSPTVVLVAGLRASADDWSISDKAKPTVFTGVGNFTRVCACDRPGTPVGEKPKELKGVYILDKDNKVKFVEVTTGITGESDIEITSGLSPGSEVITGPSRILKTLKAGDKVKKQTRTPGANANAGG
jgi:hypothetical protein